MSGLYRHHNGVLYRVLFTAIESTNERAGEEVVVYIGDAAHGVHVRTIKEWNELVQWPDGGMRPRFVHWESSFCSICRGYHGSEVQHACE